MECSLGLIVEITRAVDKAGRGGRTKASAVESLSRLSELEGKLYHILSLSLVYLSEYLLSDKSGGEESSD